MLKFGLELELFCTTADGTLVLPPKDVPTDGFPGLVELRSSPSLNLWEAWGQVNTEFICLSNKHLLRDATIFSAVPVAQYSREQKAELRRRSRFKSQADIRNLYNKPPKNLGNKSIASLQINISNVTRVGYMCKDVAVPEQYGLLDIPVIVRALDKEFEVEIKAANRQLGEYCVKEEIRLEYRSLPNSVFFCTKEHFVSRVQRALMSIK